MDLDMILDRVIQHAQNEAMNEFLAGTSRCDEVVGNWRHWKLVPPILRIRVAPSQLSMKCKSSRRGGFLPRRLRSSVVPGWSFATMPLVRKALFDLASMPQQVV